jgi:hypothetical protein
MAEIRFQKNKSDLYITLIKEDCILFLKLSSKKLYKSSPIANLQMGSLQSLYFRQNENLFSSIQMKVQLFKSQNFRKGKSEEKATDKESFFEKQEELFQFVEIKKLKKMEFQENQNYKI